MWLRVLLNARVNWKMKTRRLLESETSHANVDMKTSQPARKSIRDMNGETKIFWGFFFSNSFSSYTDIVPSLILNRRLKT